MSNDHLRPTADSCTLEDAKTAAKNGDIRLAVFLLGRYHGGVLTDIWQFVGDDKVRSDVPGELRVIDKNRQ